MEDIPDSLKTQYRSDEHTSEANEPETSTSSFAVAGQATVAFLASTLLMPLIAGALILAGLASIIRPMLTTIPHYNDKTKKIRGYELGATAGGRLIGALIVGPLYGLFLAITLPITSVKQTLKGKQGALGSALASAFKDTINVKPLKREFQLFASDGSEVEVASDASLSLWLKKGGRLSLPMTALLLVGALVEGALLQLPITLVVMGILSYNTARTWGEKVPGLGHVLGFIAGMVSSLLLSVAVIPTNLELTFNQSREYAVSLKNRQSWFYLTSMLMLASSHIGNNKESLNKFLLSVALWPLALVCFPFTTLWAQIKISYRGKGGVLGLFIAPLSGLWRALFSPIHFLGRFAFLPDLPFSQCWWNTALSPTWDENLLPTYATKHKPIEATVLMTSAFIEGLLLLPAALIIFAVSGIRGMIQERWQEASFAKKYLGGAVIGLARGLWDAIKFPFRNAKNSWKESSRRMGLSQAEVNSIGGKNDNGRTYRQKRQTHISLKFAQQQYSLVYQKELRDQLSAFNLDERVQRKVFLSFRQGALCLWYDQEKAPTLEESSQQELDNYVLEHEDKPDPALTTITHTDAHDDVPQHESASTPSSHQNGTHRKTEKAKQQ